MTDDEIKRAKELCEAATAGPWRAANGTGSASVVCEAVGVHCAIYINVRTCEVDECVRRWQADARFIAAARTLVPRLIAEVERLRRTERFLRYHEIDDEPIRSMSERLVAAIDDTDPRLGLAEDVAMNVDQLLKQRDEARAELARLRPVYEAAKAWRPTSIDDDSYSEDREGLALVTVAAAVDAAEAKERSDG